MIEPISRPPGPAAVASAPPPTSAPIICAPTPPPTIPASRVADSPQIILLQRRARDVSTHRAGNQLYDKPDGPTPHLNFLPLFAFDSLLEHGARRRPLRERSTESSGPRNQPGISGTGSCEPHPWTIELTLECPAASCHLCKSAELQSPSRCPSLHESCLTSHGAASCFMMVGASSSPAGNNLSRRAADQRDEVADVGYFVGPCRAMILSLIWL
jgi:hypothetical protein